MTTRPYSLAAFEPTTSPRVRTSLLVVLGAVCLAAAVFWIVAPLWVTYTTFHIPSLAAGILTGSTFAFLGLFAFAKRPDNRVGPLMMGVGFAFWLQGIGWIATDVTYSVGTFLLQDLWIAVLAHLFLAFPTGRLHSRLDRTLVIAGYAWWFVGRMAYLAFLDFRANGWAFDNVFLVSSNNDLADAIGRTEAVIAAGLAFAFLYALLRHWREASPAGRRVLAPVIWASLPTAAGVVVGGVFGDTLQLDAVYDVANGPLGLLPLCALPVGFVVGLFRTRLGRSRVGDLVVELGEAPGAGRARDTLARILRDPTLRIAYRLPGSTTYVDESGHQVSVDDAEQPSVTPIERAGEQIAALVHDPAVLQDPDLLRSAVAATRLAVENERLQAEVRAQLEEVRTSRARIVEAGDAERRRVERNLHDGAQQRLVMMSLSLRRLRDDLPEDAPALGRSIDDLLAESKRAIDELRELARGIHPAILTEEGIGAAVESLADRSTVAVRVECAPERRFPDPIEATAYFVVAESLSNTTKYASASLAVVRISEIDGTLDIEVADDGIGGADFQGGTGLRGLIDRVAAVGGRLTVDSPTGGGTVVHAEIPLDGH